ncbi:CDK5 regulatory subunit associated protein [Fasciola gigantica]|uniref:Threonylcarbamoyladenosine tRNA methylthiotransferase n=1 Tax=Fasciola gigantica TaxID=46835 RepID=A0A504YUX4_FASGI|nr:CDK5 regulatory subunit associated protein [Fasciola gigantica]
MDIEDLPSDLKSIREYGRHFVKARLRTTAHSEEESLNLSVPSIIPEKYRVFVQTWGCAHNTSDSEYMAGLLAKYGYRVTLGGSFDTPSKPVNFSNTSQNCNTSDDVTAPTCNCGSGDLTACCQTSKTLEKEAAIDRSSDDGNEDNSCAYPDARSKRDKKAKEAADLWVLNSCTVKGPAEDHFRNAVTDGLRLGKFVVVAGCVPQSRPGANYLKGVSVIGVQQIDRIVEVVEETLQGHTVRFLDKKWSNSDHADDIVQRRRLGGAALDLPKIRRNPLIEILAVSTGCLNACTYCKTKHARGVLASYPIDELLTRAKQAFSEGIKEIWLTSEDLGAYGRDLDRATSCLSCPSMAERFPNCLTLADLLAGLVRLIPAGCMLRLGMTNPPYILEQLEEIAEVLQHPRVYAFLHIPVQSGSDVVLDAMKREYTVDEFAHVVDFLLPKVHAPPLVPEASPGAVNGSGSLTIATDIICGFPNETEDEFEGTVQLIDRFKFPVLYINQFFARPGTPAANMPRKATTAEVKRRTRRLHDLFRTYHPYADRIGGLVRVLVTETSTDGRYWVGHTKAYEQVLVPKVPEVYGRIILVRIVECDKFHMRSDIVDHGPFDSLVPNNSDSSALELILLKPLVHNRVELSSGDRTVSVEKCATRTKSDFHKPYWLFHLLLIALVYAVLKFCESQGYVNFDRLAKSWVS